MLETLITSRVRLKALVLFAKYPDYEGHIRGLSSILNEDVGNVYRELTKLKKIGYLKSNRIRNRNVYSVDKSFPALKEIQTIVLKSKISLGGTKLREHKGLNTSSS